MTWSPNTGAASAGTIRLTASRLRRAALAWLLARSPVMVPIPGTRSIEHLEENVRAAALTLAPEDFGDLG